jgi:hypothetical protein
VGIIVYASVMKIGYFFLSHQYFDLRKCRSTRITAFYYFFRGVCTIYLTKEYSYTPILSLLCKRYPTYTHTLLLTHTLRVLTHTHNTYYYYYLRK